MIEVRKLEKTPPEHNDGKTQEERDRMSLQAFKEKVKLDKMYA